MSSVQTYESADAAAARQCHLVVRVAGRLCALPVAHVIEVLRAFPVAPVSGVPELVLGLSLVRGAPVPVVDLGALFCEPGGTRSRDRFVMVRGAGGKSVALAVDFVEGLRDFDVERLQQPLALPPLLEGAAEGAIAAIGALDADLYFVLDSARVISDETWRSVAGRED